MTILEKSKIGVLFVAVLGVGLITASSWQRPSSNIIYNPSRSAPLGWYVVKPPAELHRGDFVLVKLPPAIARLADERQYLPKTVPLLKNVGAVVGDRVCEQQGLVRINGVPIARALTRDRAGRALVAWNDCRQLFTDELFLLGTTSPASFDSRYYGPIRLESVIGIAIPVWTW